MELRIEISEETYRWLEAITRCSGYDPNDPVALVEHLVHSAVDGARRPGSWEYPWLCQAVPMDDEEPLELLAISLECEKAADAVHRPLPKVVGP